jgi:hypothetical protein
MFNTAHFHLDQPSGEFVLGLPNIFSPNMSRIEHLRDTAFGENRAGAQCVRAREVLAEATHVAQ